MIPKHLLIISVAVLAASAVSAQTITYVDANTSNTAAFDTTTYPGNSWVDPSPTDERWELDSSIGNNGDVLRGQNGDNSPGLVTTITGLTPGQDYNIYGYFWSRFDQSWRLQASITQTPPLDRGDQTLPVDPYSYARVGDADSFDAPALATGVDSGDNQGVTFSGTGTLSSGNADWTSTGSYFSSGVLIGEDARALYEASLGTITASGSGEIEVYIDDFNPGTAVSRTFYDGVGYAIPEPTAGALLFGVLGLGLAGRRRRNR
mgnify:FL=1